MTRWPRMVKIRCSMDSGGSPDGGVCIGGTPFPEILRVMATWNQRKAVFVRRVFCRCPARQVHACDAAPQLRGNTSRRSQVQDDCGGPALTLGPTRWREPGTGSRRGARMSRSFWWNTTAATLPSAPRTNVNPAVPISSLARRSRNQTQSGEFIATKRHKNAQKACLPFFVAFRASSWPTRF
jgi:hypothetical protein